MCMHTCTQAHTHICITFYGVYEGKRILHGKVVYLFSKMVPSTSSFRLHSTIKKKKHCQIVFYVNRNSIESYFMNFWTEKIFSE